MLPLRLVKTPHKILSMNLTIKFKQFLRNRTRLDLFTKVKIMILLILFSISADLSGCFTLSSPPTERSPALRVAKTPREYLADVKKK